MSQITTYKCDICSEPCQTGSKKTVVLPPFGGRDIQVQVSIMNMITVPHARQIRQIEQMDLCPGCLRKLVESALKQLEAE